MQHYDQQFANRILLLPFMHAVPPTHQDHMLLEKLKNEREGILAKAVRAFNQLESRNFVFSGDALYSFERQAVSSIPVSYTHLLCPMQSFMPCHGRTLPLALPSRN